MHIRLPPPCLLSVLALAGPCWPPPPRLTPLCVLPELTPTPLSTASLCCTFLPVSSLPPPPPPMLSPFRSVSGCHCFPSHLSSLPPWASALLSLLSLHLGPELPSLSCLVTPSPCLSVGASPPTVTATPLTLIFSYPSPRCPWPVPLAPSQPLSLSFLAPRHWESQRSPSKSEAHWWLLGAQNRGLPTPPPTRPRYEAGRGREVVVCLARRKCLCCGLVTPTP